MVVFRQLLKRGKRSSINPCAFSAQSRSVSDLQKILDKLFLSGLLSGLLKDLRLYADRLHNGSFGLPLGGRLVWQMRLIFNCESRGHLLYSPLLVGGECSPLRNAVLFSIEFSFVDSRMFLEGYNGLLTCPGWPFPTPDLEFVRYFGSIRIQVSVHLGYRATRRDACPVQCQQGWEARTEQVARRALPHRRL